MVPAAALPCPSANPQTVPSEPTIAGYLAEDQRRLDALLASCLAAARAADFEVARTVFRHFEAAFLLHMKVEEQVVFPVFEDRTGLQWGPTMTLRGEHRALRHAVAGLQEGLALANLRLVETGASELEKLSPDHEGKEANVFFPMTDRLLGPGERAALVERMRLFR
jgi:iron-sulfur cluster repair protein YtfE (RIC family)